MSESYFNGWPRSRTIEEVTGPKLIPHRSRRTSLLSYKHFYQKFLIQCFPYIGLFVAACPPQINHQPAQFVFLPVCPHQTCSGGIGRRGTCSLRALYPLHFSVRFILTCRDMFFGGFFSQAVFKRSMYRRQHTVFLWSQSVMRLRRYCSDWTVGYSVQRSSLQKASPVQTVYTKRCCYLSTLLKKTDVKLIRC